MMCSSMHETSTGASLCVPAAASLRAGEDAGAYEAHVYPSGCAAGAATLQQSDEQAEQGSLTHAALIYDYVVQDPRLAEELKSFVDNLIDEGLDKTWEQVMAGALTRTNTRKHPQTRTRILFSVHPQTRTQGYVCVESLAAANFETSSQLLELHSALYAAIAQHEHQQDRFRALEDMRDALDM